MSSSNSPWPPPAKPIPIYCGSEAGATTDLTARALAEGVPGCWGV